MLVVTTDHMEVINVRTRRRCEWHANVQARIHGAVAAIASLPFILSAAFDHVLIYSEWGWRVPVVGRCGNWGDEKDL